ncbi:glucan synthase [Umbelopsis sp. PMI_123]|nr:glucan synthase [Umbelopsis sp. PMI_123]
MRFATSSDSLLQAIESKKYRNQTAPSSANGSASSFTTTERDELGLPPLPELKYGEPYPAWARDHTMPITNDEIDAIFVDLTNKFGFQRDNKNNMLEHMMVMLESRASRMSTEHALISLHADYIGGDSSNYKKWYFVTQVDVDVDESVQGEINDRNSKDSKTSVAISNLENMEEAWKKKMNSMSNRERVRQVALYLLIWGEAAVVRYTSEAICFIFKLADDYYSSRDCPVVPEGTFLDEIISPLYLFIRDQSYEVSDGHFVKREKDHDKIIGYDDVNQAFWYPESMMRMKLTDGTKLMDKPPRQRYSELKNVVWKKAFIKTYKEKRSWMHLVANFSRIWIIHISTFWYYTAANAQTLYLSSDKEIAAEESSVQWSITALGGTIATIISIMACCAEYSYLPRTWRETKTLFRRLGILLIFLIINTAPTIYCAFISRTGLISKIVALVQLLFSIGTVCYLSFVPTAQLFHKKAEIKTRRDLAGQYFTANFPKLKRMDRFMSIGLWTCVFSCKLLESYFFLALSFKDPLKVMGLMRIEFCNDAIVGSMLCSNMPLLTLFLMFIMALCLFFLDTYLWYIIWNTVFSVARSFYLGISIWTPWRNIFSRLPKRIHAKILATVDMEIRYKPKVLCSQIWNAIVISMYREHLVSVEHVQRLLYQQVIDSDGKKTLKPPTFFVSQEDTAFKTEYFPQQSEAERRIHFFAQSLTTPMPEPQSIDRMPAFTVLVPHYAEKMILTLREIIRREDQNTRVTLLEYLKQLHAVEWDNFVKDTKIMADEKVLPSSNSNMSFTSENSEKENSKHKIDDLPFYCIGFKSSAPEYTLRTRIWASLRSQTLYRTISGFMNYTKAIKLLYRVENPDVVQSYGRDNVALERDLDYMAARKFKMLVAMQRYTKFNSDEMESAELLLGAYPDLQIAYLEEEPPKKEEESSIMYSCLIDGYCDKSENGKRIPKYRIRLPGNPILGDGKSDNQNHALIFYRGEYLQLIDANQDNYLEECLKIRNVLGEFEQMNPADTNPYNAPEENTSSSPVAIVGAREYIFSENIGILGDVAAGKEQTFGTLTQRIMAKIGGKLHYGHPDFLNAIFMTTRGGVSKAQKGLHLNEDIYAGMNAFTRGGRIKHTEYYQCGKGRDLGFGSILNFTTKIGTGMGEQMLSREYYYIGTQLPLDRFLTFYYAHPGFHINNIFIILSVQMFMLVFLFVGSMGTALTICEYNPDAPDDAVLSPAGCYNLAPVLDWIKRCILSIFLVFFMAFMPLFLQELTERGFFRSISRLGKHFISLSPLFEIFVTQIYTNSILTNLNYGGARYIATGRGFATTRIPFSILYSRFAVPSIYFGARIFIMLLFASMTIWMPHLLYFWLTVIALIFSPFVFNPNQFAFTDFLVDYREFLRWLSRGNSKTHANSWIAYCRLSRTQITGYKRKKLGEPRDKLSNDVPRAKFTTIVFSEIIGPFFYTLICMVAYLFVRSVNTEDPTTPVDRPSGLIRIGVIAFGPILLNAGALGAFFGVSITLGSLLSLCCHKFGSIIAAMAHGWAVLNAIIFFEIFLVLEQFKLPNVLLGLVSVISLQRLVFKTMTILFLTREFTHDQTNRGWWTGQWYGRGLGWHAISQPAREFVCKIIEMSNFATDFILGHFILFPLSVFCLIPYVNRWHALMLFWLRPSKQIRYPTWTVRQKKQRRRVVILYGLLFLTMFIAFAALIAGPIVVGGSIEALSKLHLPL